MYPVELPHFNDRQLYACGKKDIVLSKYDKIEPISLEFFYNKKLSGICAAEEHSIALTEEGTVLYGVLINTAKLEITAKTSLKTVHLN